MLRDSHNCSNRVHLAVDNPCLLYPNFYSLFLVSFETLQYVVWSGDSWLLENILAKGICLINGITDRELALAKVFRMRSRIRFSIGMRKGRSEVKLKMLNRSTISSPEILPGSWGNDASGRSLKLSHAAFHHLVYLTPP